MVLERVSARVPARQPYMDSCFNGDLGFRRAFQPQNPLHSAKPPSGWDTRERHSLRVWFHLDLMSQLHIRDPGLDSVHCDDLGPGRYDLHHGGVYSNVLLGSQKAQDLQERVWLAVSTTMGDAALCYMTPHPALRRILGSNSISLGGSNARRVRSIIRVKLIWGAY